MTTEAGKRPEITHADVEDAIHQAVAAERARIAEAVRGLDDPWLDSDQLAAVLAIIEKP